MHNMKRYQTTQTQTHEGCTEHTAHNAQNVAHYHCSKDLFATLLDFPNHRFFLAAKERKVSPIWRFCLAFRLVVSFTPRATAGV